MVLLSIGTTAVKLIENNSERKFIEFKNTHATQIVYISDEPNPDANSAKWELDPTEWLRITRQDGFPEKAFYAVANGASTTLYLGFQNEG